jgi:hypothetical protein
MSKSVPKNKSKPLDSKQTLNNNVIVSLAVQQKEHTPSPASLAELAVDAPTTNGMVTTMFTSKTMTVELDLKEMVLALHGQVNAVQRGDKKILESMLLSQSVTLNSIFAEMARRAALNMNGNIQATETYMRMALKAQNQARSTLETLSAIKNPPIVITKQANLTTGPQQVNNVIHSPPHVCDGSKFAKPTITGI